MTPSRHTPNPLARVRSAVAIGMLALCGLVASIGESAAEVTATVIPDHCTRDRVPPGYGITDFHNAFIICPTPPTDPGAKNAFRLQTWPVALERMTLCPLLMNLALPGGWSAPSTVIIASEFYSPGCSTERFPPPTGPVNAWEICERDPATGGCRQPPPGPPGLSLGNAANYTYGVSPDSLAVAFGQNLATFDLRRAADKPCVDGNDATKALNDRVVVVRDKNGVEKVACTLFMGRQQVNFVVPPGLATDRNPNAEPGRSALVSVRKLDNSVVAQGSVPLRRTAAGIFTADASGKGFPAALILRVRADGSQAYESVAQFNPSTQKFDAVPISFGDEGDQIYLILYATAVRNRPDPRMVTVTVGGISAAVEYSGRADPFLGLDQINVRLERSLFAGVHGQVEVVLSLNDPEAKDKTANKVPVVFQ